ncbi:MAG: nucleotidyltransferase [Candidatus Zixiibacteriota bacterium]|nr:MAG: nucleotidyltransferase [candidate division Zixibacteria bacterium]
MSRTKPQTRQEILAALKDRRMELHARFGASRLALFGSWLHGDQKRGSDVDILVEFESGRKTFDNYMELKFYLESLFGRKVDLTTKTALRSEIREKVLAEAEYVEA